VFMFMAACAAACDCARGPDGGRWAVGDEGVGVGLDEVYEVRAASTDVVDGP